MTRKKSPDDARRDAQIRTIALVLGAIALCVLSAFAGGAVSRHLGASTYTISYADFVAIMLSAISVLMTLLAMIIAVFGFIGWNAISSRVKERTENFLYDGFQEGNALYVMLQSRANEIMYAGVLPVDARASDDTDEDLDEAK